MASAPYNGGPSGVMRTMYQNDSGFCNRPIKGQNINYSESKLYSHSNSMPEYNCNDLEQNLYCSNIPLEKDISRSSLSPSKTKSSFHGQAQTRPFSSGMQIFSSVHSYSDNHCSRRSPQRVDNPREFPSVLNLQRPSSLCVKYLSESHSDNSLKNGLLHMYKEYGDISKVQIYGTGSNRYAVIEFIKSEDSYKAMDSTHGRRLFGVKIQVSLHKRLGNDEKNLCSDFDEELDEYHPKASRILFIGGLEKEITISELRTHFEPFGEIIEIAIKNRTTSTFAFCQYSDILSVVFAINKMDGRFLGYNRLKLEFGLSVPNCCIWVGGISDTLTDIALCEYFSRFGIITNSRVNRENGCALIAFESERQASVAMTEMRGYILNGKKLRIDYASNELQDFFLEKLNKLESLSQNDNSSSLWGGTYFEKGEFEENSFKSNLRKNDGGRRLEERLGPSVSLLFTDTASAANQLSSSKKETRCRHSNQSFHGESERHTPAFRAFETNSRQQAMHCHSSRDEISFHCKSTFSASDSSYRKRNEPSIPDRSGSSNLPNKNNPVGTKKSQMTRDKRTLFRKRLKLTKSLSKCTTVLQKQKVEKNIEEVNKKLKQLLDLATQMEAAKD